MDDGSNIDGYVVRSFCGSDNLGSWGWPGPWGGSDPCSYVLGGGLGGCTSLVAHELATVLAKQKSRLNRKNDRASVPARSGTTQS